MKGSLLVLLASGLSAACSAATPPDGQSAFTQRCSKCHSVQKLAPAIQKQPVSERQAWLQRFLERHYPPPQDERAAIIEYLLK